MSSGGSGALCGVHMDDLPLSLFTWTRLEFGFFLDSSDSFLDFETGATIQLLEDRSQYGESQREREGMRRVGHSEK